MGPKKLFTLFARAEMVTWALLISALVIRLLQPDLNLAVTIAGSIHGFVFLGYGITAVLVGVNQRWSLTRIFTGVSLAIVPFATYPFERSLEKRRLLEGEWRREVSNHPADAGWFDTLFRWFIKRPLLLAITLVFTAVVMFTVLLMIGPPGGSKENASF